MYLSRPVGNELLSPFGLFAVNAAPNLKSMTVSAGNDNRLNEMKHSLHPIYSRVCGHLIALSFVEGTWLKTKTDALDTYRYTNW